MQLIDGLYSYVWQGQGNNCNTYALRYIVDGKPRFALVDPGLRQVLTPIMGRGGQMMRAYEESGLEALLQSMSRDGLEAAQLGLVLNTHAHPDHCEASLALRRRSGARVALHRADEPFYEKLLAMAYDREKPAREELQPDVYLREGVLNLGQPPGIALQVLHTPGHSPGSISLWWEEKKVLITGDTVFYRSVGRSDIPGGDSRLLAGSVRKLAELKPEYVLTGHPYGHPGVIKGTEEATRNFAFIVKQVLPLL
ncbi:MAG: MBL fold metallo-hydrolase [Chloroflexota bacterium]